MSGNAREVLVIDRDPGTANLVEALLQEEGYDVSSLPSSAGALTEVRRREPALLLLDIPPGEMIGDQCCTLLDALRADPIGRRVPVMIMTTMDAAAESAVASYNVRAAITKPFDLEVFLASVRQALDLPPMSASVPLSTQEPPALIKRAERILALRSRELLLRWVHRLEHEEPWASRKDLRLSELLNATPLVVEAIHTALLYGQTETLFREHPNAREYVREHARMRRSQGIGLEAVIAEYTHLRDELWGAIWCDLHGPVDSSEAYYLQRVVAGTMDRIIELTARTYLQP